MVEKNSQRLEIINVPIGELRPAKYNPRQATKKQIKNLENSLKKFGFVEPIVVNSAPQRKNVIIGGHFRVRVAKDLGIKEIPVVYVDIPDLKKEQELNLRLNKNLGDWDYGMLANIDEEMLEMVGWTKYDINEMFHLKDFPEKEYDENIETENKCPKCGYEW